MPALNVTGPAEVELRCDELGPTLAFFVERLGFRVESIFPADDPRVATVSGHGLRLRLAPGGGDPGVLRLPCQRVDGERELIAPNGTRIELTEPDPPFELPLLAPGFVLTRLADGPAAGAGRAGMLYRDLIPGRLGGRFIASHISIPEGGPVADWTHFHKIRFQMIFCRRGWVKVVYEDQGPPFVLRAGDGVLQPPRIRHRVLESSPGLEVVEIGCPALHETVADHPLALPTARQAPARDFDGQRFTRHVGEEVAWTPDAATGFEQRQTAIAAATRGLAGARVIRPAAARSFHAKAAGEFQFGFVLEGSATLDHAGRHALSACDAFVIPPDRPWGLDGASDDFTLLEVRLPAA